MATTTPNFGWPVPTSTDLVKDGATAIEALGDSIDASLLDLKGGTTGQVLSKNSNTDMDFTWVTDAAGDITGVTAGTGISGGGTSGTVTVTNSMATAITTAGDLIQGTGSGTFDRLGIGSTGQVLTVASGAPTWATPAATASGLTLISTTTLTASGSFNINGCFSSTYDDYIIQIDNLVGSAASYLTYGLRTGSTNATTLYKRALFSYTYAGTNLSAGQTTNGAVGSMDWTTSNADAAGATVTLNGPFLSKATNIFVSMNSNDYAVVSAGLHASATSYDSLWFTLGSGTVTGSVKIYGMAK
jgi:hypothetical protein